MINKDSITKKDIFYIIVIVLLLLGGIVFYTNSMANEKAKETNADGVMIGRGIFGNPWLFNPNIEVKDIPLSEKLRVMLEHTQVYEELLSHKGFAVMKKHYKAYVHGFDGAKELRLELMECNTSQEIEEKVTAFLKNNPTG